MLKVEIWLKREWEPELEHNWGGHRDSWELCIFKMKTDNLGEKKKPKLKKKSLHVQYDACTALKPVKVVVLIKINICTIYIPHAPTKGLQWLKRKNYFSKCILSVKTDWLVLSVLVKSEQICGKFKIKARLYSPDAESKNWTMISASQSMLPLKCFIWLNVENGQCFKAKMALGQAQSYQSG